MAKYILAALIRVVITVPLLDSEQTALATTMAFVLAVHIIDRQVSQKLSLRFHLGFTSIRTTPSLGHCRQTKELESRPAA